jgi:hypothetical protein
MVGTRLGAPLKLALKVENTELEQKIDTHLNVAMRRIDFLDASEESSAATICVFQRWS